MAGTENDEEAAASRRAGRFARSVDGFASRSATARDVVTRRYAALEQSRRVGTLLLTGRRFLDVKGADLGALLTLSIFCGILPLVIIALAWFPGGGTAWRSTISRFGVEGAPAEVADDVFATAQANLASATVLAAGSFALLAYGVGRTLEVVFARAWRVEATPGVRGVLRGAGWFGLLMANVVLTEALVVAAARVPWLIVVKVPVALAVSFGFWLLTPRLLLDKALGWRGLVPTAAAGVVVSAALRVGAQFVVPGWIEYYSGPFGPFGTVLALVFWIWIVAYSWVVIACFGAVWWERTAAPDRVVALQLGLDASGGPATEAGAGVPR